MALHDLTEQRFGRLIVQERYYPADEVKRKKTWWLCKCDCGNTKPVSAGHLKRGGVRSCGCLRQENLALYPSTHKQTGSSTWQSWRGMKDRCRNRGSTSWERYGGKGIEVCERWLGKNGFKNFLADMGERPPGATLDRIDSKGNYCPENCRWTDPRTQRLNSSRTHWLTFNGKTMCLGDWAKETGLNRNTLLRRLKKGWSIEQTLTTPRRW